MRKTRGIRLSSTWIEKRAKDVRAALLRDLGDGRFTVSHIARGCLGFDGESRIGFGSNRGLLRYSMPYTARIRHAPGKDVLPAASRGRRKGDAVTRVTSFSQTSYSRARPCERPP